MPVISSGGSAGHRWPTADSHGSVSTRRAEPTTLPRTSKMTPHDSRDDLAAPRQRPKKLDESSRSNTRLGAARALPSGQAARATRDVSTSAGAWLSKGLSAQQTGDFAAAERCFRTAKKLERGSNAPLLYLAGLELARGNFERAKLTYEQVVSSDPTCSLASLGLGAAYQKLGDRHSAETYYSAALELDPECVSALVCLAACRSDQGDFAQAMAYARAALQIEPDQPVALDIMARSSGPAACATATNDETSTELPLALLRRRAEEAQERGELEGAAAYLLQLQGREPNRASTYLSLGNIYVQRRDLERAKEQFEQALHRAPTSTAALLALGALNQKLTNWAASDSYFARALELAPKSPDILVCMAFSYLERGELQRARDCAVRALDANPEHAVSLELLEFIQKRESAPTEQARRTPEIEERSSTPHADEDHMQEDPAQDELAARVVQLETDLQLSTQKQLQQAEQIEALRASLAQQRDTTNDTATVLQTKLEAFGEELSVVRNEHQTQQGDFVGLRRDVAKSARAGDELACAVDSTAQRVNVLDGRITTNDTAVATLHRDARQSRRQQLALRGDLDRALQEVACLRDDVAEQQVAHTQLDEKLDSGLCREDARVDEIEGDAARQGVKVAKIGGDLDSVKTDLGSTHARLRRVERVVGSEGVRLVATVPEDVGAALAAQRSVSQAELERSQIRRDSKLSDFYFAFYIQLRDALNAASVLHSAHVEDCAKSTTDYVAAALDKAGSAIPGVGLIVSALGWGARQYSQRDRRLSINMIAKFVPGGGSVSPHDFLEALARKLTLQMAPTIQSTTSQKTSNWWQSTKQSLVSFADKINGNDVDDEIKSLAADRAMRLVRGLAETGGAGKQDLPLHPTLDAVSNVVDFLS